MAPVLYFTSISNTSKKNYDTIIIFLPPDGTTRTQRRLTFPSWLPGLDLVMMMMMMRMMMTTVMMVVMMMMVVDEDVMIMIQEMRARQL